jgi:hypothetical protein
LNSPTESDISPTTNSDLEAGEKTSINHAETISPTFPHSKWKLSAKAGDGDTALALFSNPDGKSFPFSCS